MSGSRSRRVGHGWERELAEMFRSIGYKDVITTRQGSRELDNLKIDLMNSNTSKEGRLPWNVQAKCVKGHLSYGKVLEELPTEQGIVNVICHKSTKKVNNRFIEQGRYAILYLDDFIEMVKKLREYEKVTIN